MIICRFVLLFNANLDRAEHLRKSVSELRKDLKKWEDNQEVKRVSVDDTKSYLVSPQSLRVAHVDTYSVVCRKRGTRNSGNMLKQPGQV